MEFPDIKAHIRPLMHMVCLVWANSRYYNSPARIIVLLQATCNFLIQQVSCSCSMTLKYFYMIAELTCHCGPTPGLPVSSPRGGSERRGVRESSKGADMPGDPGALQDHL